MPLTQLKEIRFNTLVKLYQGVQLLTILRDYGEDEITGDEIASTVKPGDIVRLPTETSTDWDGCESFEVLPIL